MNEFIKKALEGPRVRSVKVLQVICVESQVGDGKDTPLRPYMEYFSMDGKALPFGDVTVNEVFSE